MILLIEVALLLTLGAHDPSQKLDVAVGWNSAAIQGVRDAKLGAPVSARALAIMHTCMYDAWSAYDEHAVGTQLGAALRRPASERTLANKEKAISYAAYRALVDLLPADTNSVYIPLMKELGYDPKDNSVDIEIRGQTEHSPILSNKCDVELRAIVQVGHAVGIVAQNDLPGITALRNMMRNDDNDHPREPSHC